MMAKKLVKVLVALLLLLCGLVVALFVFINPIISKLKPQLVQLISDAVKHPVTLGEISLSFFPEVALEVEDVALEQTGEGAASIGALVLRTGLMGLVSGKVAVDKITAKDADLTILREANGRISMSGLELAPPKGAPRRPAPQPGEAPSPDTPAPFPDPGPPPGKAPARDAQPPAAGTAPPPPATGEQEEPARIDVQLRNVEVDNLNVLFIDRSVQPEQRIEVRSLSADAKNIGADQEGTFALAAAVLGAKTPNLSLNGSVNLAKRMAGIPATDAALELSQLDLARVMQLLSAYKAAPPELALGNTLQLKVRLSIGDKGMRIAPELDAKDADVRYGAVFNKPPGTPLAFSAELLPTLLGTVQGEKVKLQLAEIALDAPFSFDPQKGTSAQITSNTFSLAGLDRFLPAAAPYQLRGSVQADVDVVVPPKGAEAGPAAKGVMTLSEVAVVVPMKGDGGAQPHGAAITDLNGKVSFEGDTVQLKPFSFALAGQQFTVGAKVQNLKKPEVKLALQSDSVALGTLMSALKPGGVPALADSVLNKLQLVSTFSAATQSGTANLTVADSTVARAPLKDVNLTADYTLGDGGLAAAELKKSSIGIFGGTLGLDAQLQNSSALQFGFQGTSLSLPQISDLAMPDSRFKLTGTLQSAQGRFRTDTGAFAAQLAGDSALTAIDGEIRGFNLLKSVLDKVGAIPGLGATLASLIPPKFQPVVQAEGTKFDKLTLSAGVARQNANIKDFALIHELYSVTGAGDVGFGGTLDLRTQFKLSPKMAEGMTLKEPKLKLLLDGDGNLTIPVLIKKDGAIPVVLPDVSKLAQNAARNTAKEAGKRALDKALDKVAPGIDTKGLGDALDSLFK